MLIDLKVISDGQDLTGYADIYFFKDGALDAAREAETVEEAERILSEGYLGPDPFGVEVIWTITNPN